MSRQFYSNCLVWAYCKKYVDGGFVKSRPSRHFRLIPHFLWSADGIEWVGFSPVRPKENWIALLFCWWFLGHVEKED